MAFPLLLAAGLLIRLLLLGPLATTPLVSDAQDYREMAMRLVAGDHFVPYWPPGLPLYLTPFVAAGGGLLLLRASMLVWWLLFAFGFARLAADLRIRRPLWLGVLAIFTVSPAFVHFSLEPMTQMPAAALLVWALSSAVRCAERPSWREALLLGGSSAALVLVRPSSMILVLLLPAVVAWRTRRTTQPLLALVVAGTLLAGWAGYAHHLCGRWMINSANGVNVFYGNNPWTPLYRTWYFGSHAKLGSEEIRQYPQFEAEMLAVNALPETERSAAFQQLAKTEILAHPGEFLLRTANRIRCFWGFDTFTGANLRAHAGAARRWSPAVLLLDAACYLLIAGLAAFALASAPLTTWRQWPLLLLASVIVLYALPYWTSMSHPSYHFPVVAPLALLGLVAYQSAAQSAARWRGWAALACLALIQVEWVYFLSRN